MPKYKYKPDIFDNLNIKSKLGAHRASNSYFRTIKLIGISFAIAFVVLLISYIIIVNRDNNNSFHEYELLTDESGQVQEEANETPEEAEEIISAKDLNIIIYNSTDVNGLAAGVKEVLEALGYEISDTTNAPDAYSSAEITYIYYADESYASAAQEIADAFYGSAQIEYSADFEYDLAIVLGSDYALSIQ